MQNPKAVMVITIRITHKNTMKYGLYSGCIRMRPLLWYEFAILESNSVNLVTVSLSTKLLGIEYS
jgi:hypothetical protein